MNIQTLYNLEILNLSHNNIESFEIFEKLLSLQSLDLSHN